ncbi:MAG TPA: sensor domain-containing diguanylate cyclase [Caldimonas sp.]
MVLLVELLGRPPALDPAMLLPVVVLAATALGGITSGALAGVVGGLYLVLYYSQPAAGHAAAGLALGGMARVVGSVVASAFAAWVATMLRERSEAGRVAAAAAGSRADEVADFATRLANEPPETMPGALIEGAAELLQADMAVLTVLDPPSGRHYVRAAHGGATSAVGVEVLPGVGIAGQAIRDRRLIVTGDYDTAGVPGLKQRLRGKSAAHSMAAVAGLQAGRVIASLTVGRAEGAPFSDDDQRLLEAIGALVTLAVSGSLARSEVEEGSPHDHVTGLYNRAYLDATMEQLVALRHRLRPEERPPLSMIMFDIDSFALINERHGRQVGDQVLRGVATLLRQRFRASDITARIGPDSFFVVLNGADAEIAAEAAAHIRRQVRELNLCNARGEPVIVSVSAGCAFFHDGDRPEALYRSVEAALETARWSGPGAVVSI